MYTFLIKKPSGLPQGRLMLQFQFSGGWIEPDFCVLELREDEQDDVQFNPCVLSSLKPEFT